MQPPVVQTRICVYMTTTLGNVWPPCSVIQSWWQAFVLPLMAATSSPCQEMAAYLFGGEGSDVHDNLMLDFGIWCERCEVEKTTNGMDGWCEKIIEWKMIVCDRSRWRAVVNAWVTQSWQFLGEVLTYLLLLFDWSGVGRQRVMCTKCSSLVSIYMQYGGSIFAAPIKLNRTILFS